MFAIACCFGNMQKIFNMLLNSWITVVVLKYEIFNLIFNSNIYNFIASGKIRKSDESLMAMLKEQQNEFLSNESKRWEEEKAREERMRKEDKEHELKLFSMFATIIKGQP